MITLDVLVVLVVLVGLVGLVALVGVVILVGSRPPPPAPKFKIFLECRLLEVDAGQ